MGLRIEKIKITGKLQPFTSIFLLIKGDSD